MPQQDYLVAQLHQAVGPFMAYVTATYPGQYADLSARRAQYVRAHHPDICRDSAPTDAPSRGVHVRALVQLCARFCAYQVDPGVLRAYTLHTLVARARQEFGLEILMAYTQMDEHAIMGVVVQDPPLLALLDHAALVCLQRSAAQAYAASSLSAALHTVCLTAQDLRAFETYKTTRRQVEGKRHRPTIATFSHTKRRPGPLTASCKRPAGAARTPRPGVVPTAVWGAVHQG